jgi:hypothetical protein
VNPVTLSIELQPIFGLSATVKDANTDQRIDDAILTLREGDYTEVMTLLPNGTYVGANERPGTYDLTIEVPGVATDTISKIVITADDGHVRNRPLSIQVLPGYIMVVPANGGCDASVPDGVTVSLTSASGGDPVTNAILTLTGGDYTEVLGGGSDGHYYGATGRRGTFTLDIEAPGFDSKTIENIVVTRGICTINPVILSVQLEPAS